MAKKEFTSGNIQEIIGYNFKNSRLLQQAFTRSSYAQENQGIEHNEILEFYGDSALNLYVCRSMVDSFGKIDDGQFISEKNEGELSEIRSLSVNKKKLAHCIQVLGLEHFLLLGSSDIKNEVWKSESVKEDLFEAIVGAVAIDSKWNFDKIKTVCENLFSVSDFTENYIELLEEQCLKHGWDKPILWDKNYFARSANLFRFDYEFPGFRNFNDCIFPRLPEYSFILRNIRNSISDCASVNCSNNAKAIMLVAKKYYEWIIRRDKICKVIETIDENLAANQLHEIQQKGLVKEPSYTFSESHDENGNSIWTCSCKISDVEFFFESTDPSKKKAKQKVAAVVLRFLLGEEIQLNNDKESK